MLHFLRKRDSLHLHIPYQEPLQHPNRILIILIHLLPCFLKQSDHMLDRYSLSKAMQVLEYKFCNKKLTPLIFANIKKQHAHCLLPNCIKPSLMQQLIHQLTSGQFFQSSLLSPHPL